MAEANYLYSPQPGSVAFRVCEFFIREPDEHLSSADIALKFDCGKDSVVMLLRTAADTGLLTRHAGIYGPGPKLAEWHLRVQQRRAATEEAVTTARSTKCAPAHLPELGATAVGPVEEHVPLPRNAQELRRGRTKYDHLFAGLTKVGQSRTFPVEYTDAIKKAALIRRKYHREHYVIHRLDAMNSRIWRVEPKTSKASSNDSQHQEAA